MTNTYKELTETAFAITAQDETNAVIARRARILTGDNVWRADGMEYIDGSETPVLTYKRGTKHIAFRMPKREENDFHVSFVSWLIPVSIKGENAHEYAALENVAQALSVMCGDARYAIRTRDTVTRNEDGSALHSAGIFPGTWKTMRGAANALAQHPNADELELYVIPSSECIQRAKALKKLHADVADGLNMTSEDLAPKAANSTKGEPSEEPAATDANAAKGEPSEEPAADVKQADTKGEPSEEPAATATDAKQTDASTVSKRKASDFIREHFAVATVEPLPDAPSKPATAEAETAEIPATEAKRVAQRHVIESLIPVRELPLFAGFDRSQIALVRDSRGRKVGYVACNGTRCVIGVRSWYKTPDRKAERKIRALAAKHGFTVAA